VVIRHWQSGRDNEMTFALLLIATVLVSPHTSVYDLVLLSPALVVFADRLLAAQALSPNRSPGKIEWALVGATFIVPLLPSIAQYVHFQPSVIVLGWLLFRGCRMSPAANLQSATSWRGATCM
jgi:hypothetical protein